MLKVVAKYLTKEISFCPYCGSDKLSDGGTDKVGFTLIFCWKCFDKFFVLTGQRKTEKWWRNWWNRAILKKKA